MIVLAGGHSDGMVLHVTELRHYVCVLAPALPVARLEFGDSPFASIVRTEKYARTTLLDVDGRVVYQLVDSYP